MYSKQLERKKCNKNIINSTKERKKKETKRT